MKKGILFLYAFLFVSIFAIKAQHTDSAQLSLDQCIQYAIKHQPVLQQALIDQSITEQQIQSRLADWYPQLNFNFNYQYYFQQPVSLAPDASGVRKPVTFGVKNNNTFGFALTQNIFNRDVLTALRTQKDVRTQAAQNATGNRIDVIVNVSKAYYDVLLTQKRIEVLVADTQRLARSLKDAKSQFDAGLTDKTDYKRATISLNNSRAELVASQQEIKAKYAYLKQAMGYENPANISLTDDTTQLLTKIFIDTSAAITYDNRIEYQLLKTRKKLQEANLKYYQWGYLPTVSAFGNYNFVFMDDKFSKMYNVNYPNSYAGLTFSFPLFQGTKRIHQVKQAELELKRIDWDFAQLQNSINTQYAQALAEYKSYLNNYYTLKENRDLANDVYNIIDLQYKEGIKTYLEVIVAQSDLRTAQLNYFNALFQVLSSRVDVERALGLIQ